MSFPPFSVFSQFVSSEAKARNDPSFNAPGCAAPTLRRERHGFQRNQVTIHRTSAMVRSSDNTEKRTEDPNMTFPIHRKPHPLRNCKGFSAMLYKDRKKLLKNKGICFHCCTSATHLARDSDVKISCTECLSERHVTALHPSPRQRSQ